MTMKVNAFASEVGSLSNIPVVDAVVVFDCPYTGESYFMLMYNCLYIPSMECHLIPPFILREAGLYVSDTPKIQSPGPDEDTHVIFDHETKMRIHLGLNGIFSYFNCRSIAADEMKNWRKYKVVESTPLGMRWDPYNPVYQEEEEAMLDGRGEVLDKTPDRNDRFNLIEKDDWHTYAGGGGDRGLEPLLWVGNHERGGRWDAHDGSQPAGRVAAGVEGFPVSTGQPG